MRYARLPTSGGRGAYKGGSAFPPLPPVFSPDSTAWNFDIAHEMSSTWAGTPRIRGSSSESVQMVLLTISLTGVQLVWGIEMACEFFLRRVWAGLIM
jgi:hypothetical protein